jgi:hypothetical protein
MIRIAILNPAAASRSGDKGRTMKSASVLRHSRRLAVLCLPVVTLAVSLTLAQPAASGVASAAGTAHASWKYWQLDGDRCRDAATMDANHNGYAEDIRFDIDNDCRWDTRVWNSRGRDSFRESLIFDMNEDGRWDLWLVDNNNREGFDVVYFDDNRDGYYDRWAHMAKAAPKTMREAIEDSTQAAGVVGGTPESDGISAVLQHLVRYTGRAYLSPGDNDQDGTPDDIDPDSSRTGRCTPYRIRGC